MSPKIATLSLALALALALTLTFASANGGCKDSLPEILESYDLPGILFPEPAQQTFTCKALNNSAVSVKFTLQRPCRVTRTLGVVKNVLTCAPEVSATVSYRRLSNVKGITVRLYISFGPINFPFPFAPGIMTVTDAIVFYDNKQHIKKLQFLGKQGNSPAFDINKDFPPYPPTCDSRHTILPYFFAADDDHHTTSNQDITDDIYGGRPLFPLPVVA